MSDAIDQLSDAAIERYARQLVLPEIGVDGQLAIDQAHMAVIGCGGLGANAALALCQAGVGRLDLIDPDAVELSNLHRQPFRQDQVGMPKAEALAQLCAERNAQAHVHAHIGLFSGGAASIWLDCTDTYESRLQISTLRRPGVSLIFGAVIGMDAQVSLFDDSTAAFTDVFSVPVSHRDTCADQGVMGPLAIMVAQIMACEALRVAMGSASPLRGRLLMIDARDWRQTLVGL